MARPRSFSLALIALLVVAMFPLASCGRSPEQELLGKYFQASRLRDNTTLGNIATVSFSPTQEGTISKFSITRTGEEKRTPLRVRELAKTDAELRKAEEEFNKKKKEYQDANREAIDRVLKAEGAKATLKGKDVEIQAAWRKWRDDTAAFAGKLTDSRKALAAERGVAELSTYDARNPVDAAQYDGELITREIFFDADVKAPDGAVTPKKLHAVLSRAELKNGPDGKVVNGRWVVTHVSEEGAPAPAAK
jgi:hypothetical protein